MSTRPLSERHHDLDPLQTVYEVRVWDDAGPAGWRTLCCCARPEDAALLASATVASAEHAIEFAEVWGPSEASGGSRRVVARFPAPTPEEQQDMWRRAVDENYATAYIDLKR